MPLIFDFPHRHALLAHAHASNRHATWGPRDNVQSSTCTMGAPVHASGSAASAGLCRGWDCTICTCGDTDCSRGCRIGFFTICFARFVRNSLVRRSGEPENCVERCAVREWMRQAVVRRRLSLLRRTRCLHPAPRALRSCMGEGGVGMISNSHLTTRLPSSISLRRRGLRSAWGAERVGRAAARPK